MQNSATNPEIILLIVRRLFLLLAGILAATLLAGCSGNLATLAAPAATLTPPTENRRDLLQLPQPLGKIKVAVYNFRDQSGQYKPLPGVSSFSTAVSQGGTAMLTQALKDSGWFIPVEREGLQNLLTERKIVRAFLEKQGVNPDKELPALETAAILIEGGVIGYDTNVATGGLGAKYFGIGGNLQYRVGGCKIVCVNGHSGVHRSPHFQGAQNGHRKRTARSPVRRFEIYQARRPDRRNRITQATHQSTYGAGT